MALPQSSATKLRRPSGVAILPWRRSWAAHPPPSIPFARRKCAAAAPQRRGVASASASGSSAPTQQTAERLLDAFWKARGVVDADLRRRLVAVAAECEGELSKYELASEEPLPGIHAAWFFEDAAASTLPQVREVSRRLLALHQLLGGRDDVDVVWMVVRQPGLLSADFKSIMRRLLDMRVSEGVEGVDVVRLVESQPALLLQQDVQVSREESAVERLQAWQHGLVSDNSSEWERRLQQLQQYQQQYGDPHVGYREGDDPELANWAAKQRSEQRKGQLSGERQSRLEALGFEFDSERSEWLRWFNEIRAFRDRHGHATPVPLAAGSDFLLINWCSVQRIAARSRVLSPDRIDLLDSIGFDWSGADALS